MNTRPTPETDAENDLQCELAAWELLKEARRERDEAREQRDRLAEALARTRNMIQTHPEAAESCATEVLQSLTPNEP
jgi:hypothetical protein